MRKSERSILGRDQSKKRKKSDNQDQSKAEDDQSALFRNIEVNMGTFSITSSHLHVLNYAACLNLTMISFKTLPMCIRIYHILHCGKEL